MSTDLTKPEAAKFIGVSVRTLTRYISAGIAPEHTTMPSGRRLFPLDKLRAWKADPPRFPQWWTHDPVTGNFISKPKA